MKESRHANFAAIQAIFLQLSLSQHKSPHSCHGRGQRSNGAINRNKHFVQKFLSGHFKFGYSLSNSGRVIPKRNLLKKERNKQTKRERAVRNTV